MSERLWNVCVTFVLYCFGITTYDQLKTYGDDTYADASCRLRFNTIFTVFEDIFLCFFSVIQLSTILHADAGFEEKTGLPLSKFSKIFPLFLFCDSTFYYIAGFEEKTALPLFIGTLVSS
jgi:hypothetical protein